MKLPGYDRAQIAVSKVTDYLLNPLHEQGGSKARYFLGLGFDVESLITALLEHAATYEAVKTEETQFGVKYRVEGVLETPSGRRPNVLSSWIVRTGEDFPRLTSAYPIKRRKP